MTELNEFSGCFGVFGIGRFVFGDVSSSLTGVSLFPVLASPQLTKQGAQEPHSRH